MKSKSFNLYLYLFIFNAGTAIIMYKKQYIGYMDLYNFMLLSWIFFSIIGLIAAIMSFWGKLSISLLLSIILIGFIIFDEIIRWPEITINILTLLIAIIAAWIDYKGLCKHGN